MRTTCRALAASALLVLWCAAGQAQTVDEIIEKHLAAMGGRAALSALTSQVMTGTIALSTPVGELQGAVETYAKKPNKSRTLITIDLSAVGAGGEVINDQRFDGTSAYLIDSLNGNRPITGTQLDVMKNTSFPTPLLNYRDLGWTIELAGTEPLGGSDAYVLRSTPKTGPVITMFIDVNTWLLVRTSMTVNVPEIGGDLEQVVEFADFRDVNGIKVPYSIASSNRLQNVRATATTVQHNVEIDDSSFSKPQ